MEIQTIRGFVLRIEIGRAGLVTVHLIHDDGSAGIYVIEDLDADPERFNERLSKLGLLRDAMNRAEPVEIEHASGEAGRSIERVSRISRDELKPVNGALILLTGFVLDVNLHAENRSEATGERADIAQVKLLDGTLVLHELVLQMQAPERLVANHQLEMIREAQQNGLLARLLVETGVSSGDDTGLSTDFNRLPRRIIAVAVDYDASAFGDKQAETVSGFVEAINLIRPHATAQFAHVRLTSTPEFSGPGGTVGLDVFNPAVVNLLVPRNSDAYDLFTAGLRDGLRMRVSLLDISAQRARETDDDAAARREGAMAHFAEQPAMLRMMAAESSEVHAKEATERFGFCFAAELLAPLASASRPVWITIARQSLDQGPDGFNCTTGVPTSDLGAKTLRDLRIPYQAVWTGLGCFNHGVYRFQFYLPTTFKVFVDGEELCLHEATESGHLMAHACLHGEHEVRVEVEDWICDYEFIMDVFRLR